jgi:hypothetical protein
LQHFQKFIGLLDRKLLVVIRNRTSLIRWSVPIQTGSDYKMRE